MTERLDHRLAELRAKLPVGYRIEIGGSVEENAKANASISVQMPVFVVAVLMLLMIQLQSLSRVLLVVLTAPLGLIGVDTRFIPDWPHGHASDQNHHSHGGGQSDPARGLHGA